MGTVDGKYSSPPSASPAAPNFNVVVRRVGALGTATSGVALDLNVEMGARGGGASSGRGAECFPSTVGHVGFADKRASFFGFFGRTEKALRAYARGARRPPPGGRPVTVGRRRPGGRGQAAAAGRPPPPSSPGGRLARRPPPGGRRRPAADARGCAAPSAQLVHN